MLIVRFLHNLTLNTISNFKHMPYNGFRATPVILLKYVDAEKKKKLHGQLYGFQVWESNSVDSSVQRLPYLFMYC